MAVTKQAYTATATWTATQLADIFKQAFIDAGLMTDWFDSFLSGSIENRILRVINNGSKTYGTVYYWFMFTTTGVFVATTTTWNATTHVPTGTQYIDYYSTTTNATTNHTTLLALANTTTCTLTRYTSGINSNVSIFLLRQGSSYRTFMLSHPSFNASSFVNQDIVQFNSLLFISASFGTYASYVDVYQAYHTRASYLGAAGLRGSTGVSVYANSHRINTFLAYGNSNGGGSVNIDSTISAIRLPVAFNNTNTNLASNHTPLFTSPPISPYMSPLPADFGITSYYPSSTMVVQDTLVVSSGTEEWEMLVVSIPSQTTDSGKALFCARTV